MKKKRPASRKKSKTCTAQDISGLLNAALRHHKAGQLQQAEQIYLQLLEITPDNSEVNHLLGVLAHQMGKNEEAARLISKAVELAPDRAPYYCNLGLVLFSLNKNDEAAAAYQNALRIDPGYATAHNNLGNVFKAQGRLDKAARSYLNALSIRPDYATAFNNLGNVRKEQGRFAEAAAACQKAISIKPNFAEAHYNMGIILSEQGKLDEARESHERALRINPAHVQAHNSLGNIFNQLGKQNEAASSFQRALQIDPGNAAIHRALATLRRHTQYNQEIRAMETLINTPGITPEQRMHLDFGLGKAYEDLGEHERSFAFVLEGNRLKRSAYSYDISEDRGLFKRLATVFSKELVTKCLTPCCSDNTPVFILGMPRSGTSLVEQILASHPEVHGAGELKYLDQIIHNRWPETADPAFPECIWNATAGELNSLASEYIKAIRRHSESASHITDKMPGNFLYVGIIGMILPRAKIIHCRRDPRDTCLSIFKNYFTNVHKYAYDLRELGEYYLLYHDLMKHWHSVLPGRIYGIQYEELVFDAENQIRRLLEYCGLEWNDACLSFHKTERPVRTTSKAQVRQPVYTSSVQLWKAYGKGLAPLLDILNTRFSHEQ